MKRTLLLFGLLAGSLLQAAQGDCTLTIEASGFKNDKGEAQFSLYNKEGTIPDKALNLYFKKKRVKVTNGKAKVLFRDLPKGRYAVSLYHDENNNHKIDKGLIMPVEGVGLSNFESINFFHLPNFKAASFPLEKDETVKIKVLNF